MKEIDGDGSKINGKLSEGTLNSDTKKK
jgi:hypothetical protein